MKKIYCWGILAPGKIAHRFTEGLKLIESASLCAVGSRDLQRAKEFAELHGYRKYYGTYEELVADPEVDVVYVASPHSHHMEHTLLCLEGGKSVICEKAFAINSSEVNRMIDLARSKNLFLMEALWPPFQPSYQKGHEILLEGKLGEVMSLRSYFAFRPPYEPEKRLYNTALGGGSLLDIGIYPVIDALTFLGVPDTIETVATFDSSGADDSIAILFGYKNGKSASLYTSLKTESGVGTDLICEKGTISLRRESDGSQFTILHQQGKEPVVNSYKPPARGFHFEAMEVMDRMNSGELESRVVPLSFSVKLIETLDRIRKVANIVYNDRE